jgi:hypothetical protein
MIFLTLFKLVNIPQGSSVPKLYWAIAPFNQKTRMHGGNKCSGMQRL